MPPELSAVLHGFESFVQIKTADSLHHSIGDNGYVVVTDHGVSLISRQFPDGHTPAMFVLNNERANEIARELLIDDVVERVCGAKRVPQREDGVVREVVRSVN